MTPLTSALDTLAMGLIGQWDESYLKLEKDLEEWKARLWAMPLQARATHEPGLASRPGHSVSVAIAGQGK